ncbi:Glutamate receptor 1.1 [Hirschfeldia incana]|nr:Glutamate receptor 1.1 [Hirschfeldia incana]
MLCRLPPPLLCDVSTSSSTPCRLLSLLSFVMAAAGIGCSSHHWLNPVKVTVGLVVDLGSTEGEILETSFALALSDFYRINKGYRTRVSVLARDSQGDPLLAYAAVTNLIKNSNVEAIIGAQSLQEAKLLAAVSKKVKVPVISLLAPDSLSLNRYDHFIQTTHDKTSEAKGLTSLIHDLNRTSVVVIYEDADDWRESLQTLVEHFQDERISINRTASFSESSSGEDHIMDQLRKLNKVSRTAVYVVHMSENLVSSLLQCAEKLGLMEQGHVWILTARSMHHFHFSDHFATRSMQGLIGFRSYVPLSSEIMNFTSRVTNVLMETKRYSVWAHDVACILATAAEKMSLKKSENVSSNLLETMRQSSHKGLSHGDIQMVGNKFLSGIFEIVDMIGTRERRIGLWSCDSFCGRRDFMATSEKVLEIIPRHRFLEENGEHKKLLRVLVPAGNKVPNLVSMRLDPETSVYTATGFCIEVFKTCIAPFNYQLEFIPYNGNYNNLAYLLSTQSDKYDAAVGDITITSNRSLYVDFTLPFTDIGIGILTVKKKSQGMWTFFDPFDTSLWLASGAFFILTGVVVWLVERSANPEFQGSWGQQLCMMLWFGFSTIVFAHREKLEKIETSTNGFGFMFQRGSGVAHALVIALHLVHMRQEILAKLQSFYY